MRPVLRAVPSPEEHSPTGQLESRVEQMCLTLPGLPLRATRPVPCEDLDVVSGAVIDIAPDHPSVVGVHELFARIVAEGDAARIELDDRLDQMELLFDGVDDHTERRAIHDGMYTDADGVLRTRYGLLSVTR